MKSRWNSALVGEDIFRCFDPLAALMLLIPTPQQIAQLPKAELHCHLDGLVTPALARTLRAAQPDFPIDPDQLERYLPVYDAASFFRWMGYIRSLERHLDLYRGIIAQHLTQLKSEGVRYLELMIANGELADDPAQAVDELAAFRAWVTACEGGAIQVEFLLAVGRSQPPERLSRNEPKIRALFDAGLIVGVALGGPEIGNPVKPYARTFARLHEAGIRIEIHAGEWAGAASVWDALEYGYPDRIGHGVALFDDPRLIALFQERQLPIEMCPTSNLRTGSIARIEAHPIGRARDLGLNFSVNTDDPGVFQCSMSGEYRLLAETFGFSVAELTALYERTLAARFQPVLRL